MPISLLDTVIAVVPNSTEIGAPCRILGHARNVACTNCPEVLYKQAKVALDFFMYGVSAQKLEGRVKLGYAAFRVASARDAHSPKGSGTVTLKRCPSIYKS